MKSILLTLFKTKKGLELLDNEYEDDLWRKSAIIFGLYAMIQFLFDFDEDKEVNKFILNLMELIFFIFLFILVGMFCSLILYKIGKWMKGKAKYIEIYSLSAYALIPITVGLIIRGGLKHSVFFVHDFNNPYSRNFILYLSWFFSLKILILGLTKFNQYGIKRAILNLSPFILLQISLLVISLILS
ncbi:YIP1 family protein [Aquimarina sediminis]|uniref:YIP1 family protein n=1 Tax=Aquimarina sediminis TaxID=2070536 RepID=UPI000CA0407D|nr:YIP1 family protein [Aquimarina sediminis]